MLRSIGFLENNFPGIMSTAVIGFVLSFPITFQLIGAISSLDHQLVGDGGHKRAKGKADFAGVGLAGGRVPLDDDLHSIAP